MTAWKLADAKNRFSELVNRALADGPQQIRRRNDTVVVISLDEYKSLLGTKPTLKQHLMQGNHLDDVDLARDKSPMRDVVL